jgi:triphosphoribosyl-dephospho-CoA synthase
MNSIGSQEVFSATSIASAIGSACIAELHALKPGNVSVHSEGHGMAVDDFVRSAWAIAPALVRPGLSVGGRTLAAIQATRRVVDCNTNLGIVLLCAPLAHAALHMKHGQTLREALGETLLALDANDTALTYEAIRLAEPAGLGDVEQYDVRTSKPAASLYQVMQSAQGHDRIARQYASNYADIFELAVPRLYDGIDRWDNEEWAAVSAYLGLLSALPDTHIERKHGSCLAQDVGVRAKRLDDMLLAEKDTPQKLAAPLMQFDVELKRQGINPGTSADLTVAALTVKRLQDTLHSIGQLPILGRGSFLGCCSSTVSLTAT